MHHRHLYLPLLLTAIALTGLTPAAADTEDGPEPGWSKTAELSLVSTSGNSETDTVGLNALFVKSMARSKFKLEANGLRAESTATRRTAVGPSPDDFAIDATSTSVLNAENYSLSGRYDRQVNDSLFWFVGLRWQKNEFAGFSERLGGVAGLGNTWWEDDDSHFSTDYSVTWTRQDDLVPSPGLDDSFAGLRLSYDYGRQLNASTEFGSVLVADQNLDESADRRADLTNWLAVSISDRLALKVSFQALWDNLPALAQLPLEFPAGSPTGDTVVVELDSTDTVLTTALVITF